MQGSVKIRKRILKKLAVVAHVLSDMQNEAISRCCVLKNGKEINKDL